MTDLEDLLEYMHQHSKRYWVLALRPYGTTEADSEIVTVVLLATNSWIRAKLCAIRHYFNSKSDTRDPWVHDTWSRFR